LARCERLLVGILCFPLQVGIHFASDRVSSERPAEKQDVRLGPRIHKKECQSRSGSEVPTKHHMAEEAGVNYFLTGELRSAAILGFAAPRCRATQSR
jgi:hypothetical protein